MKIAVACSHLVIAGGLIRFDRVGQCIASQGHELAFISFSQSPVHKFPTSLRTIPIGEAQREAWDAVIVPGAGFPTEVIEAFCGLKEKNFGLRLQMILNDQTHREGFRQINASFDPDLVIFNNLHWPIGSFREFTGRQFHYLIGAVDTELFHPAKRVQADRFIVGAQLGKNPQAVVDAIRQLPEPFELRFFGPGSLDGLSSAADLIEAGRVSGAGPLFGNQLADYYRGLSAIVSTETFAGWANVVAEAMASGVPVITTPAGTLSLATHEETALVVPAPDPHLIAAGLLHLRNAPNSAASMASRARRHVEPLNWVRYSSKLLDLIRDDCGETHYLAAPELGLYGKTSIDERLDGLDHLLAQAAGRSILDLGAAEGIVSGAFLERGASSVHAYELEGSRVEAAQRIVTDQRARFSQANLADTSALLAIEAAAPEGGYGTVLYLGIHHHLPKPERTSILKRLLKLSSDWFAVRTPLPIFEGEQLGSVITSEGFGLEHASIPQPGSFSGPLWIFRRRVIGTLKAQVISYPKSGRSWLRYMMQVAGTGPVDFHHDGFEFNDRSLPALDFRIDARLARYAASSKLIYVSRDPRDVMVSLFHQVTGRFGDFFHYEDTISEFLRHPYFGAENLLRFQQMWNEIIWQRSFLSVRYEDLHEDPARELRRVLAYLGKTAAPETVRAAVEAGAIDNMRELERSESFPQPWLRPRNGFGKVRAGKVGSYRTELSEDDIVFLNEVFAPVLAAHGTHFTNL